jgi:hypothetical protein
MARRTADRTDKDLAEVARAVGRQVQQSHSRSNRCLKGLLVIINCYYRIKKVYVFTIEGSICYISANAKYSSSKMGLVFFLVS